MPDARRSIGIPCFRRGPLVLVLRTVYQSLYEMHCTMPAPLRFPANPKLSKDEKLWYLRGKENGSGRNIFIIKV